ncbi:MAG TPA: DUF1295 domain-containing protein [Xanthomonadales bacterium]|nr:DUF1295 domain-containing protein [Xanthomonadales bacterium]
MHPVLVVLIGAAIVMAAVWLLQLRTRNAGYVDVAWAALMGLAALWYGLVADGGGLPRLVMALLAATWGFRLALHLLHRVMNEPEDGRYRHLREHWRGSQAKFFGFFMFQAALTALFSLPFYIAARNPVDAFTPWTALAIAIWIVAIGGETIADRQLARFRADPANRGRTCRAGLWRYSRHPNYFFAWLHWFTYVALSVGAPMGWLSLLGPVLMGASLAWITGIPFVEQQALRSRGEDYRRYQRETSAFFPWFPKPPQAGPA